MRPPPLRVRVKASGEQDDQHHADDTADDGDIREVEHRPDAEIEEIDDEPARDAVDQVARRPGEQRRDAEAEPAPLAPQAGIEINRETEEQHARRDKEQPLVSENPEGRPWVEHIRDMEDMRYHRQRLSRQEGRTDIRLDRLIAEKDDKEKNNRHQSSILSRRLLRLCHLLHWGILCL